MIELMTSYIKSPDAFKGTWVRKLHLLEWRLNSVRQIQIDRVCPAGNVYKIFVQNPVRVSKQKKY